MNETNKTHRPQTQLGYAALNPFFGQTISTLIVRDAELRNILLDAQITYAGLIASFLGGIHWGVSLVKYGWLTTCSWFNRNGSIF